MGAAGDCVVSRHFERGTDPADLRHCKYFFEQIQADTNISSRNATEKPTAGTATATHSAAPLSWLSRPAGAAIKINTIEYKGLDV